MKYLLTVLISFTVAVVAYSQNPYESIGRYSEMLTLSGGAYEEFIADARVVRIGSVLYDTEENKVVAFIDTGADAEPFEPEVRSRFLSVDPLAASFPSISPYVYVENNPISFKDPTGLFPVCTNCDDIYEKGAIVTNSLGEWKYLGDNQWETISLNEGVTEYTSTLSYLFQRAGIHLGYDYYNSTTGYIAVNNFPNLQTGVPGSGIVEPGGFGVVGRLSTTARSSKALVETASGILRPGGSLIGTQLGSNTAIRTVSQVEAQSIVSRLITSGARISNKPGYPGTWYELPGGGGFGVRNTVSARSRELGSTGAIDINIPGIPLKNIKW